MRTKSSNKAEKQAAEKVYPEFVLPDGNTFGELLEKTFEPVPAKDVAKSPKSPKQKKIKTIDR